MHHAPFRAAEHAIHGEDGAAPVPNGPLQWFVSRHFPSTPDPASLRLSQVMVAPRMNA